jgi:phenylalanyl-tRNA synthetase beta chain
VTIVLDPTFFPGRAATIIYRSGLEGAKEIVLGALGILHPNVLMNFEIPYPCSALEFNLEPFLKEGKQPWE